MVIHGGRKIALRALRESPDGLRRREELLQELLERHEPLLAQASDSLRHRLLDEIDREADLLLELEIEGRAPRDGCY